MLSISTHWNYSKDTNIVEWLKDAKSVGFDAIELDYAITREHIAQLKTALKELNMTVSSVHNFCPTPNDQPTSRHISNYYRLSSLDESERKKAVQWTCNSVNTAAEFGAKVVVVHAGTVESDDDYSKSMFNPFKERGIHDPQFIQERDKILAFRKMNVAPYLDALVKSFNEILPYAVSKGILIGLEVRYYPTEIPNFDEIGFFLKKFYGKGMGYWHDTGHAEINSRLGIKPHDAYLKDYGQYLIGIHIHGMNGSRDHLAPFQGDLDLSSILSLVAFKNILKVVETKHATLDEMREGVKKLQTVFEG